MTARKLRYKNNPPTINPYNIAQKLRRLKKEILLIADSIDDALAALPPVKPTTQDTASCPSLSQSNSISSRLIP